MRLPRLHRTFRLLRGLSPGLALPTTASAADLASPVPLGGTAFVTAAGAILLAALAVLAWWRQAVRSRRERAELEAARRRAETQLDEARQSRDHFLASVSHEIRTPLNGVLASAELLGNTPLTPEQRECLATMQSSAESLVALLNDLLDFARIEAGAIELERSPFSLRDVAADVVRILAPRANVQGLELVLRVDATLPGGYIGDAARLRQVLLNLVTNAVRFTAQGHVVVEVTDGGELPTAVAPGLFHAIRFTVSDTGIGIEPAEQATLLLKPPPGGPPLRPGRGLAICRALVDLLGGTMGLRSEPGRGSQFWFVVPLEPNPRVPMPPMAEGRPLRVLLVDDLAPARHATTELLQICGALVDAVGTARDAREVLRREARSGCSYDAFIFDHSVLAADDGGLLLAIKHPNFGTVRRILLASSLRYPEVPAEEPGDFDAVVVKPVLTHETLNQALRGQRATRPPANAELHRMPVSRYRALVAEDNVINQIVLGRMLAALGCSAEYADTGAQAVTLATERHYDIIFMDIRLPEIDGIEATRQIRARRPDGSPPIIAVTANNSLDDRSDCLAAGMNDYLQKPVRIGELLATIDRWIAVRPA